ncbi:MAG: hypothetical protein IJ284_03670 [Clostridia bacterium]|nr:hypothetical protein [Clostridia bacterium]
MGVLFFLGFGLISLIAVGHLAVFDKQRINTNSQFEKIWKAVKVGDWIIIGIGILGMGISFVRVLRKPLLIAMLTQLALVILHIIYIEIKCSFYNKEIDKAKKEAEKERKAREVDIKAIEFYNACEKRAKELKVDVLEVIPMLGKNFNKNTVEQANKFYEKGKAENIKKKEIIRKDAIAKEKQREKEEYNKVYSQSLVCGREKYLVEIKKAKQSLEWMEKASKSMMKIGEFNQSYQATNQGWGLTSGAMSALFGVGAGVATAATIQAKNLVSKAREREAKATGERMQSDAIGIISVANCGLKEVNGYIQYFDSVLIDESNIEEKFEKIIIKDVKILPTKGEQLLVKASIGLKEEVTLLNQPAILDGVLTFTIYHNDEKIAESLYVADGYGQYNYINAGFKKRVYQKQIIFPLNKPIDIPIEQLRCEITPKTLWVIEKNENIFKIKNESIAELQKNIEAQKNEASKALRDAIVDWKI